MKRSNQKKGLALIPGKNYCVEVQLHDGSFSMYIGELISADGGWIVLRDVSWIASTGRRHLFFAGNPDSNVEIEPYPDGVVKRLPADGAMVTDWPHPLPRQPK